MTTAKPTEREAMDESQRNFMRYQEMHSDLSVTALLNAKSHLHAGFMCCYYWLRDRHATPTADAQVDIPTQNGSYNYPSDEAVRQRMRETMPADIHMLVWDFYGWFRTRTPSPTAVAVRWPSEDEFYKLLELHHKHWCGVTVASELLKLIRDQFAALNPGLGESLGEGGPDSVQDEDDTEEEDEDEDEA